jgi:hypothetical protein
MLSSQYFTLLFHFNFASYHTYIKRQNKFLYASKIQRTIQELMRALNIYKFYFKNFPAWLIFKEKYLGGS